MQQIRLGPGPQTTLFPAPSVEMCFGFLTLGRHQVVPMVMRRLSSVSLEESKLERFATASPWRLARRSAA